MALPNRPIAAPVTSPAGPSAVVTEPMGPACISSATAVSVASAGTSASSKTLSHLVMAERARGEALGEQHLRQAGQERFKAWDLGIDCPARSGIAGKQL